MGTLFCSGSPDSSASYFASRPDQWSTLQPSVLDRSRSRCGHGTCVCIRGGDDGGCDRRGGGRLLLSSLSCCFAGTVMPFTKYASALRGSMSSSIADKNKTTHQRTVKYRVLLILLLRAVSLSRLRTICLAWIVRV